MNVKPGKDDEITFLNATILGFAVFRRQNISFFLIMSQNLKWKVIFDEFVFQNVNFYCLILSFSPFKFENDCQHRILRPKWCIKYVSHDTDATFLFVDLIWSTLTLIFFYLVTGVDLILSVGECNNFLC